MTRGRGTIGHGCERMALNMVTAARGLRDHCFFLRGCLGLHFGFGINLLPYPSWAHAYGFNRIAPKINRIIICVRAWGAWQIFCLCWARVCTMHHNQGAPAHCGQYIKYRARRVPSVGRCHCDAGFMGQRRRPEYSSGAGAKNQFVIINACRTDGQRKLCNTGEIWSSVACVRRACMRSGRRSEWFVLQNRCKTN